MSEIRAKAEQLLANRLDVIAMLEEANADVARSKQQLKDAESQLSAAWVTATETGWTRSELKRLGFEQPAARRGGRPKQSRTRGPRVNSPDGTAAGQD